MSAIFPVTKKIVERDKSVFVRIVFDIIIIAIEVV